MQLKDIASESGHWYQQDGTPAYTTTGKSGKTRPTTLRDARKTGLLPSVTTIMKCAASPGLELWKTKQAVLAALTLPKIEDESEEDYLNRIFKDSREQAKKAAERGEKIHGALEKHFSTGFHPIEYGHYVAATVTKLDEHFGRQKWCAEKSFAHAGFGGKVDLHSPEVVVDFKTKEFGVDNLPSAYDEHIMQLAAYRTGLGYPAAKCANVFISVSFPGLVHIVEHSEEDLERGWNMFACLLDYWKIKNNYEL